MAPMTSHPARSSARRSTLPMRKAASSIARRDCMPTMTRPSSPWESCARSAVLRSSPSAIPMVISRCSTMRPRDRDGGSVSSSITPTAGRTAAYDRKVRSAGWTAPWMRPRRRWLLVDMKSDWVQVFRPAPQEGAPVGPVRFMRPGLALTRVCAHGGMSRCLSQGSACNCVIAAAAMISSTEHPRDRSFAGFARPCRMGPMAVSPPRRCAIL